MLNGLKGTPSTWDPEQMIALASNGLASRPIIPLSTIQAKMAAGDITLDELHQQKRARDVQRLLLDGEMRILNVHTSAGDSATEREKQKEADPKLAQKLGEK
jgi:hypothetical protein